MLTARTVIFHGAGQPFELAELPVPAPGPGEILVRNEYTTLCRSDLYTYTGKRTEKTPTILGHEITGRIVSLGPDTPAQDLEGQPLASGARITWAIFASNPESALSKKGIPQKGEGLIKYGHEPLTPSHTLHGGLSQYTLLRPHTPVLRLTDAIPVSVAATLNCAVATIAGALRVAGDIKGQTVLVSGAGMLGLIACAMSHAGGAAQVIALDINPERLDMAAHFGASLCLYAGDDVPARLAQHTGVPNPVHVVIEVSGQASAMAQTLDLLAIGGIAVWQGAVFPQQTQLNAEKIIRNLLTIKGLHNYNLEDFRAAVRFMTHHHQAYPFERLIHTGFSLEQAEAAFAYAVQANPFRVGIQTD